jgi:hypothetical protein
VYLLNHYENIKNLSKIYDKFLSKYPKINWVINHKIDYNGSNTDFKICKYFQIIGYDEDNILIIYIKPQFNLLNYNDVLIESIYDTFILKSLKNDTVCDDGDYNKKLEDYNKFANKNIYTIVFSLDNNNYHSFQWKNLNNNLLIEQIKSKLINKYKIDSKKIFNYYKYWKQKYIHLSPDKIIKNIINEYKKNKYKDKHPHFILKFFEKIQSELSFDKLINYDNADFFNNKLEEIIIESIEDFLGIE